MNDPLLLIQIVGCALYSAATLSAAVTKNRARGVAPAWLALLLAIGIATVAAIGEYWIAMAIWIATCALAIYRVVQEERRAVRRG